MREPEYWFPCLSESWYWSLLALEIIRPSWPVTYIWQTAYDLALLLNGIDPDSSEGEAFSNAFRFTFAVLIIDREEIKVVQYNTGVWDELEDYIENNLGERITDCPVCAFPGNQGGAWPVLWPPTP